MNLAIRYALKQAHDIRPNLIALLHAGTDHDSVFLSSIITEPQTYADAVRQLVANGTPLAFLWARVMVTGTMGSTPHQFSHCPLIDHPLSYYDDPTLEQARKYADPFLYDRLLIMSKSRHTTDLCKEAAMAGSAHGMMMYAVHGGNDMPAKERREWYDKAMSLCHDFILFWQTHRVTEQRYTHGRLLCAIGSERFPGARTYYLDQRDRAMRATVMGMLCMRRLKVVPDIVRLIGHFVFYADELYDRKSTRVSKRLKKLKK